jgi:hypothetical protein
VLEILFEQTKFETQEERERRSGLEQKVTRIYENIPPTAQTNELTTIENIDQIV